VREDQRGAFAVRLVVELDAVDRGEGHAPILGGGRGKRNREGGALATFVEAGGDRAGALSLWWRFCERPGPCESPCRRSSEHVLYTRIIDWCC
jgi:hypothetical protein